MPGGVIPRIVKALLEHFGKVQRCRYAGRIRQGFLFPWAVAWE